jgi:hypothetical protein
MSEFISPEEHRSEVAALRHEIYRLSKQLDEKERERVLGSMHDRRDPFDNPTEYHDYSGDYAKILPQIDSPGAVIPLEPQYEEKRRIKRFYTIGAGCLLGQFLAADILVSLLMLLISGLLKGLNSGISSSTMIEYVRSSSILAGMMLLTYMTVNVAFGMLGLKLSGTKFTELIKTRDYNVKKAAQYCLIAVFLLFVSTIVSVFVENLFTKYGYTTDVIQMDGIAVTRTGKAILILYQCVIAPVTEELFFRGMLLKNFTKANQRFGVFATAVFFGLAHGNIPQFLLAFMLGIFLAHLTLKHCSIIPAIVVHIFVNSFSTVASELDLTGNMLIIFNEIFIVLAVVGGIMLIVFRSGDKLPASTPAQARRGLATAMVTPVLVVVAFLQVLYMMSLIFSGPFFELIRNLL